MRRVVVEVPVEARDVHPSAPRRVDAATNPDVSTVFTDQRAKVRAEVARLLVDVGAASARIRAIGESEISHVSGERASLRGKADAEFAKARSKAASERDTTLRESMAEASALAARLADGVAGCAWGEWSVDTPAPSMLACHIRIGVLHQAIPAVVPFLGTSGIVVRGAVRPRIEQVENILLRTVGSIPARNLRLVVVDPMVTGRLGHLGELRSFRERTFPIAVHTSDGIEDALKDVLRSVASNGEVLASEHCSTMNEVWATKGYPRGEVVVLVLLDYPMGVDDESIELLRRIATTGPDRGVSIIVDAGSDTGDDRLTALLTAVIEREGSWTAPGLGNGIDHEPRPGPIITRSVVRHAVTRATSSSGPTVALSDLIGTSGKAFWTESSLDGIEAIIGVEGNETMTLNFRSENPPHPNALLGGAVGQGKSNLLLNIVYSVAARYSPEEVVMYLLDFKQGLEFQRLGKDDSGANWLPHARLLCLESSTELGRAVLDHLLVEMERRAAEFGTARASSYSDYRSRTGRSMPRIMVVIDEFQVLFDGDDDMTADSVRCLDTLAKQGRAFGIHILLASQTVSGISGLRVKGDSIFAQFPLRLSLKNTAAESEAILGPRNRAASDLSFRGEVVVNRDLGAVESNRTAVAAYGEPEYLSKLQQRLFDRARPVDEPWMFFGRGFARWPSRFSTARAAEGWVGHPVTISDRPVAIAMTRDVDQAIAVVGAGVVESDSTLASFVVTSTHSWDSSHAVTVLCGEEQWESTYPSLVAALSVVSARGVDVAVVGPAEVSGVLLGGALRDDTDRIVVCLDLQKVPGLSDEIRVDPDDEYGFETHSALTHLRDLAQRGAVTGTHLIGRWPTLRAVTTHLGFSSEGIGTFVFARPAMQDLQSICGPHAARPEGSPRTVVFRRDADEGPITVVPFEAPPGPVATLWRT